MDYQICDVLPEHIPQIAELETRCFSMPWSEEPLPFEAPENDAPAPFLMPTDDDWLTEM